MTAWMQGLIDSSKIIRLSFSKSNSTYTKKDRETPSFRLLTKPNSSKRWALFYVKAEKKDKEIGGIPRVEALSTPLCKHILPQITNPSQRPTGCRVFHGSGSSSDRASSIFCDHSFRCAQGTKGDETRMP